VLSAIESDPRIGIAGPRLLTADGSLDHAAKRSFPTPLSALGHFTGIGRRSGATGRLAAYRAPRVESGPVDAVNGAFMLMRRAAFDEAGGFDEGYWMYMEDLDLSYQLAQAGWITWYEPGATVHHVKGGSSDGARSLRLNWAFHKGMLRFYRKHYARERSWATNVVVYLGIAIKFATAILHSALRRILVLRRHRRPSVVVSDGGSGSVPSGG
jgi:GT2 family glycosyltransferase